MKCHPNGEIREEAFTERNGFWLSLYPEDYLRVIQPTKRSDELSRKARAAVITMLGTSTCRRSKNEWYDGWEKEREQYTPKETKASGSVPAYKPIPLLQHPPAKPSAVRSSAIMVSSHVQPIASVPETPVVARSVTPRPLLHSITPMPASCPTTPLITQSSPFAPDYDAEVKAAYEALEQLKIIKINLMPDACSAILKEGMQFFQVKISNDVFTSSKSMQALARRMATLDLNIMGPCPRSKFIEINNRMKLEAVAKALGIDENLIVSVQMTETSFEPPAKRKRTTSVVELSNLSTSQRATNLLERGCFPLFQPARRKWTEEKTITLKAGEISLLWPPFGWKNLCGDSKLLQWEVAAYKLCEATQDPATMVTVNRSDLLDRFNYLRYQGHHAITFQGLRRKQQSQGSLPMRGSRN